MRQLLTCSRTDDRPTGGIPDHGIPGHGIPDHGIPDHGIPGRRDDLPHGHADTDPARVHRPPKRRHQPLRRGSCHGDGRKAHQGRHARLQLQRQEHVQGTGSTIVEIGPSGTTTFADITSLPMSMPCPGGIGLSTALAILPDSDVVVGSFPDAPGDKGKLPNADPAGCLIVLNDEGTPVETITSPEINGPWDMTAATTATGAALFVSDDLSRAPGAPMTATTPNAGSCTVVRVDLSLPMGANPKMTSITTIGAGYPWKANLATFIQGPTGLALGHNGTPYMAETLTNSITAIPSALTRATPVEQGQDVVTTGGAIDGPLGLATAPNGDIIVTNGNNGNLVEITPSGKQVVTTHLIANGAGDLFGLAVLPNGKGLLTVNDGKNALDEVTFPHH